MEITKKNIILMLELSEHRHSGELELKRWLRLNDYIVEDVSDNPHYWDQDIDLIAQLPNSERSITIEVKWDTHIATTGNLFIETSSDLWNNKPGWFNFCKADYIYYGDYHNRKFYKISRLALKEYIEENKEELKYRTANDYYKGNVVKQSGGYLVPLDSILNLIEEEIDLGVVYETFRDI